jgi:hypothetical protein
MPWSGVGAGRCNVDLVGGFGEMFVGPTAIDELIVITVIHDIVYSNYY